MRIYPEVFGGGCQTINRYITNGIIAERFAGTARAGTYIRIYAAVTPMTGSGQRSTLDDGLRQPQS